ncbi:AMP-binding protein [Pseudidiomarina sediminum]|uniref:AMP-binding protein n=1 Tax=Pseudidiomarina sediminum TaxID=431675 RepID=UPI001C93C360|nr:AMP-binding protein [Pseudidiomarina sediminum]MBY6064469.1 AMP-binding protein [Pseudidiomarina sediminum]
MIADFFRHLENFATTSARLSDDHRSISYQDLLNAVDAMAIELQRRGSQRIALLADNSLDWLISDLAALKLGLTMVPIPAFFTNAQRQAVFADAEIDTIITDNGAIERIRANAIPHAAAKITYTSGSTGAPKGVCLSAEHLLETVRAIAQQLPDKLSQRHLCCLPLAVLLENIAGAWLALYLGASIHLPSLTSLGYQRSNQMDATLFFAELRSFKAHSVIAIPALAELLLQGCEQGALNAEQFRFIAVGGATVAPHILERAAQLKLPLYEGYGLSECGSVVALNTPTAHKQGTVGRPLPHQQVRVVNGQIYTAGPYMMGYLNHPTPASDAIWHATGDLGTIDADGYLSVTGRASNLIITSYGRNISPEWIETLAQAFHCWLQFMVVGDAQAQPIALITPSTEATPALIEAAIKALNQHLPDYAQLAGWLPTKEPFSLENQLLTYNNRFRRKAILKTYAQAISQFYGDTHGILSRVM